MITRCENLIFYAQETKHVGVSSFVFEEFSPRCETYHVWQGEQYIEVAHASRLGSTPPFAKIYHVWQGEQYNEVGPASRLRNSPPFAKTYHI